jgi:hypothetical protein
MKPQELLAQNPEAIVVDTLGGATFKVSELAPIIISMIKETGLNDAKEFAARFEIVTPVENRHDSSNLDAQAELVRKS